MNHILRQHGGVVVVLFAPALVLVSVLMLIPFANGLVISFTNINPTFPDWSWTGLDNYVEILTDPTFWDVIGNSCVIVGLSVVLGTLGGLALAILLNEGLVGTRLYRTLLFQGWIVPWITVAVLWGWMFSFDYGIVNQLLIGIGIIDHPLNWLAGPILAKTLIITGFVWRIIPYMMIMALAALQGIDVELHEAARIDGASYGQRLRYITLPLVRNVVLVASLLQGVRLFQEITLPFVATQGGPVNATTTLSLYTYKLAFQQWDFGLAGAVGAIWSILLIVIAAIYVWLLERSRVAP
jgi:multiple sugar transport system permease protein